MSEFAGKQELRVEHLTAYTGNRVILNQVSNNET